MWLSPQSVCQPRVVWSVPVVPQSVVEAGRSEGQGHACLTVKFEASVEYQRRVNPTLPHPTILDTQMFSVCFSVGSAVLLMEENR